MQYIEKAIQLKKELDALRPLTQDDEARIMQKFRLDWNYHSNHLEGNSLTYGETKALILFGLTAQGKPLKDHFEITGHDDAVKWISEIVKQERPLSENFIRELHTLILKESYETDAITPEGKPTKKRIKVGEYKTTPNHVKTKTGEIFRFATPEETPAKMHDLIEWYREKTEEKDLNPILVAVEFHYKYIRIHPFDDGNGRTARLLMNFILMQYGYPPVIIKTDDKENYFAALRQADAGILKHFVQYITENLNHSLELMIKGAKGESIEEPDDLDKKLTLIDARLKNVSKTIQKFRTEDNILEFYDTSISKLFEKFRERCQKFEKYYRHARSSIAVGNMSIATTEDKAIERSRDLLITKPSSVRLIYEYNAFNQAGMDGFGVNSEIRIEFNDTRIHTINTEGKNSFVKYYGEDFSDDEIDKIVSYETNRHAQILQEKIEYFEKTKND